MTANNTSENGNLSVAILDKENESQQDKQQQNKPKRKRRTCAGFCKKFFWEGQILEQNHQDAMEAMETETLPQPERFFLQYRRVLALILPGLITHFFWWAFMIQHNLFYLYEEMWFMAVTMVFGSMVAGMTSEGGGAIAFPVMTFAFKISPVVARDFSLMIQSAGMTCAAVAILFMKVQIEWTTLVTSSLGGVAGLVVGFHLVDPHLSAAQKKMGFVSIWFSFAFALFLLNRYHKRRTFSHIPDIKVWKLAVLFLTGVVGGICTSFAGNGLDICTFSILTLLFRVSEKVATPTSVILMSINTIVGWFWREIIMQGISQEAYDFFYVCISVVVVGAPLGSVIGSHFHRLVLACMIYVLDAVTLVTAFIVVPQSPALIGMSLGIMAGGFVLFFLITFLGNKILERIEQNELLEKEEDCNNAAENGTTPFIELTATDVL